MKSILPRALVLSALLALPVASRGVTVVTQPNSDVSMQVEYFEPLGQSFTAVGNTLLSFEFYLFPMNPFFANVSLTLDIRQGAGTGGAVLDTVTLNLADGYVGWAGSAFNVSLVTGQQYTATLDTSNPYWGLAGLQSDGYAGGQSFAEPGGFAQDFMFRATFDDTNVPDTANTLGLLTLALTGLVGLRRRLS